MGDHSAAAASQDHSSMVTGQVLMPAGQAAMQSFMEGFHEYARRRGGGEATEQRSDRHSDVRREVEATPARVGGGRDLEKNAPSVAEQLAAGERRTDAFVRESGAAVTANPGDQAARARYQEDAAMKASLVAARRQQEVAAPVVVPDGFAPDLPEAGKRAIISRDAGRLAAPEGLRGLAISIDGRASDGIDPGDLRRASEAWIGAAEEGRFTRSQAETILKVRGQVPTLNDRGSRDVARVVAADLAAFAQYRSPGKDVGYLRLENPDGSYQQGLAARERDGEVTKEGTWLSIAADGRLQAHANYRGGLLHGESVTYHDNGRPAHVANYADGLRHGRQISLSAEGAEVVRAEFQHGQPVRFDTSDQSRQQTDRGRTLGVTR